MAISLSKRHAAIGKLLAFTLSVGLIIVLLRILWDAYGAQLLGHYRYAVAPRAALVQIEGRKNVKLRRKAALAYLAMVKAARRDGVKIVAVSGYRDLAAQQHRFFAKAAERNQSLRQRSLTCAPPGYSEHHTGYSIDVIDGSESAANQAGAKFRKSAAYLWLVRNASRFHFELSFPQRSRQSVAFEPRHWRYVGDAHSFVTFYRARIAANFPTPLPQRSFDVARDEAHDALGELFWH